MLLYLIANNEVAHLAVGRGLVQLQLHMLLNCLWQTPDKHGQHRVVGDICTAGAYIFCTNSLQSQNLIKQCTVLHGEIGRIHQGS